MLNDGMTTQFSVVHVRMCSPCEPVINIYNYVHMILFLSDRIFHAVSWASHLFNKFNAVKHLTKVQWKKNGMFFLSGIHICHVWPNPLGAQTSGSPTKLRRIHYLNDSVSLWHTCCTQMWFNAHLTSHYVLSVKFRIVLRKYNPL